MKTVYRHGKSLSREFRSVHKLLQIEKRKRKEAEVKTDALKQKLIDESVITGD